MPRFATVGAVGFSLVVGSRCRFGVFSRGGGVWSSAFFFLVSLQPLRGLFFRVPRVGLFGDFRWEFLIVVVGKLFALLVMVVVVVGVVKAPESLACSSSVK